MNFTSLKYFLVAAQELNITRAAQQLYVSQQSLSEHIARLEEEYGVKLFERSPRLRLTYAGQRLQSLAEETVNLDRLIRSELTDIAVSHRGSLSVGITPTHGRILIPGILQKFRQEFPNVELQITTENSRELLALLHSRKLDLACTFASEISNLQFEPICDIEQRLCLVIPENLLDKDAGTTIDRRTLQRLPYLLLPKGSRLRNLSNQFFYRMDIDPMSAVETRDLESAAQLCCIGLGAFLCNELYGHHFIHSYKHSHPMYLMPIEHSQETLHLSACYHRKQYLSDAARAFICITRQTASELTRPDADIPILTLK